MSLSFKNMDAVIKTLAKMEDAVTTDVVREARKNMRATLRKYIPLMRSATPKRTGEAAKSIKLRSRSRRGMSSAQLVWIAPYAGYVNFNNGADGAGFASDEFRSIKSKLDKEGERDVIDAFKRVMTKEGVEFK